VYTNDFEYGYDLYEGLFKSIESAKKFVFDKIIKDEGKYISEQNKNLTVNDIRDLPKHNQLNLIGTNGYDVGWSYFYEIINTNDLT
jgi:hypothetical protein